MQSFGIMSTVMRNTNSQKASIITLSLYNVIVAIISIITLVEAKSVQFDNNLGEDEIGRFSLDTTDKSLSFILLTTGHEIKLYPLHDKQKNNFFITPSNLYVLRSKEFDISDAKVNQLIKESSPSFSNWLEEKARLGQQRMNGKSKQTSILPRERGANKSLNASISSVKDDDEDLHPNQSGWKRPLISDVDYFFDPDFCREDLINNTDNLCMVVVWLDQANNHLRFGSFDLNEYLTNRNTPETYHKNGLIWMREYPPVDICRQFNRASARLIDCHVNSMAFDRGTDTLHLVIQDKLSEAKSYILSGQLRPNLVTADSQFVRLNVNSFGTCYGSKENRQRNFMPDDSGSWMYYVNRHGRDHKITRVMAINLQTETSVKPSGMPSNVSSIHLTKQARLDKDILRRLEDQFFDEKLDLALNGRRHVVSIAIDYDDHLLYWLFNNNEIFCSDLAGDNMVFVDKLSLKPAIRSPDVMLVYRGTLFISDSTKKSIMTYKLNKSNHSMITVQAQPSRRLGETTHEVLLVEMVAILGFRVVDTSVGDRLILPDCETVVQTERPHWLSNLKAWLFESDGHKIIDSSSQARLKKIANRSDDLEGSCVSDYDGSVTIRKQTSQVCLNVPILNLVIVASIILAYYLSKKRSALYINKQRKLLELYAPQIDEKTSAGASNV